MINATNKYKEYVSKKSRTFIPRLVIENQEYKRILNFEYEDGLESSDEMSLGSTISKSLKFSISAVEGTFNNKQVTVYIGLKTNTGIEEIKKATLTVVKATRKDGLLNFECYDQFYFCEKVFVTDLTGTQKVKTIVDEQCKKLGITFNGTIEDTSYNVDLLKGLTIREALSYLSAWCGKNAHFNNDGQLEFIGYDSAYEITTSKYSSLDLAELDTTINSLNCITKESVTDEDGNTSQENKELTCGEGYGISFSCLGMTQERLNVIYKRLKGFKYRSATVSLSLSDPVIEPGDIIKLGDYFIPVMNITSSCDGGFQSEITAYAKTEQEQEFEFKGSLASQVERNYQEEASFRKLITENIKAFKGQFDEIDVDVININKKLSAQEANIKKLDTEKLSAQEATIKYAQITDLKAVSGKFDTLESDYGKFKDLTSTNITGINANIKQINADNVNIANRVTANEGLIKNLDTVKLNAADAYLAFAKISDLNATNANVTNLNADLAKINTLLSGSVTAGSTETIVLNAKNTTIENALIKDAMIDSLSFNKISGVDINTTKITVHSDDGKSTWVDNTIKIADSSRTRVQIGKDSEGDYNIYIWDKAGNLMFDPLGLTDKGVTREVIDNSNVKENAGIAGSKLDIDSVVTEINEGSTTIKSSKIWLDEDNQSFNMSFKEMKESISTIEEAKMYRLEIISSNGILFKNNNISTVLFARVWSWDEDVTDQLPESAFIWTRTSDNESADEYWNQEYGIGKKQLVITTDDVNNNATFSCELII